MKKKTPNKNEKFKIFKKWDRNAQKGLVKFTIQVFLNNTIDTGSPIVDLLQKQIINYDSLVEQLTEKISSSISSDDNNYSCIQDLAYKSTRHLFATLLCKVGREDEAQKTCSEFSKYLEENI